MQPHSSETTTGVGPSELEQVLRILFARKWFNLSDTVVVEAVYYSPASAVCRVWTEEEPLQDEATLCEVDGTGLSSLLSLVGEASLSYFNRINCRKLPTGNVDIAATGHSSGCVFIQLRVSKEIRTFDDSCVPCQAKR